ncbi:hypothetical protein IAR50_007401 [Cryptococcus sp. DSM 104548]
MFVDIADEYVDQEAADEELSDMEREEPGDDARERGKRDRKSWESGQAGRRHELRPSNTLANRQYSLTTILSPTPRDLTVSGENT